MAQQHMSSELHKSTEMDWLDLRRLTQYAAVSERTLRSWIHSPVDPLLAVQVRGKILVRRTEFDRWLERHRVRTVDLGCIVSEVVEAVTGGS
jgi:hypothetical protein